MFTLEVQLQSTTCFYNTYWKLPGEKHGYFYIQASSFLIRDNGPIFITIASLLGFSIMFMFEWYKIIGALQLTVAWKPNLQGKVKS